MIRIIKHTIKKLLIRHYYKTYVANNSTIQQDVENNFNTRQCKVGYTHVKKQFTHLMLYYPEYAFLFYWRIGKLNSFWYKWFTKDYNCKIFKSANIAGGITCYHPFSTVINAKSIGANFQFRNGLTIGNKNNDNTLVPTIGNNVVVGTQVVIIGDITIGDNAIIGAGSVVVKDVPANAVVAGNPAKVIRMREAHD